MINKSIDELKIAVIPADTFACGRYRLSIPYNDLKKRIKGIDILDLQKSTNLKLLSEYDIIVNQRVTDMAIVDTMKELKKLGKVLIHELDDNLFHIKRHNPSYETYKPNSKEIKAIFEACKISDYIHTTTQSLTNSLLKKIYIDKNKFISFNNALDVDMDKYKENWRDLLPKDKIVIGYQGGSSHYEDLKEIASAVRQIIAKYPNVVFAFCSTPSFADMFNLEVGRIIIIPPETQNFINFLPIPSMFDIGLIPIIDDEFNNCKSYLKILEYAVYKVPTICSKVGDYIEYDKKSPNSTLLVKNRTDKWIKAIEKIIQDESLRKEIGNNAYNSLFDKETSLEYINNRRFEFYRGLCNE